MDISAMVDGAIEAMLFAESVDSSQGDDTSFSDAGYSIIDLEDDTRESIRHEVTQFAWVNRRLLRAAFAERADYDETRAGHDYYFTTAGHGVGYWDRGLSVGQELTDACGDREWCPYVHEGRVRMD